MYYSYHHVFGANDEDMKRMTEKIFRKLYGLEKKAIKVYGDVPHI